VRRVLSCQIKTHLKKDFLSFDIIFECWILSIPRIFQNYSRIIPELFQNYSRIIPELFQKLNSRWTGLVVVLYRHGTNTVVLKKSSFNVKRKTYISISYWNFFVTFFLLFHVKKYLKTMIIAQVDVSKLDLKINLLNYCDINKLETQYYWKHRPNFHSATSHIIFFLILPFHLENLIKNVSLLSKKYWTFILLQKATQKCLFYH
jgi:hypothetical protein